MATRFTVMTWNVENLFPAGYRVSPQKVVLQADYDAKLEYLARRILEVAPDVLALQEIGSDGGATARALDDLQQRLQGLYPFQSLSCYPDGRGIRVAFLSRLAILRTKDVIDLAPGELASVPDWYPRPHITRMGRCALQIEVEPAAGLLIRVLTLHVKSKLISYPATGKGSRFAPKDENERATGAGLGLLRRTAECMAVRAHLNACMTEKDKAHTVVLGDLNDEPQAATSQILLGPEDADVTSDDKLDSVRLYNLMASIPGRGDAANDKVFLAESERFSRLYQGKRELIDHIYVSKGMLGDAKDMRKDRWRVQAVRSLVDSIQGESVGDNPGDRIGRHRPDHAPIYACFEW